jgi:hypothetical protein
MRMSSSSFVLARVSPDTKERVRYLCRRLGIKESELLKRLIHTAIDDAPPTAILAPRTSGAAGPRPRVSVRLRPDDILLLRERARAQQQSVSSYASSIVRIHVQAQTPLPASEIAALKRNNAEVNEIGRRLNDLARAINQGEQTTGPSLSDLKLLLDALIRMRDRFHAVLVANARSWCSNSQEPD